MIPINSKKYAISMRYALCFLLLLTQVLLLFAQKDTLSSLRVPKGYNYWLYLPTEYYDSIEQGLPLVVFLHGASLCGVDMKRVLRYGPINAVGRGRKIPAIIVAPQNPGGAWNPIKVNDVVDRCLETCRVDSDRIYVIGMSLGGYGTMDYVGTYPQRVAAAMALCGGTTLKDMENLGEVPLWIMHGTNDLAVPIQKSKRVVEFLQQHHNEQLLRYDWLRSMSHGALARLFYLEKTYEWLFSHSLRDAPRMVNREIIITNDDLKNYSQNLHKSRW